MRFRRHSRGSERRLGVPPWLEAIWTRVATGFPVLVSRTPGGRRTWLLVGGTLGAFAVGYLVAVLVLFPAPIFATTITVPRVLGLSQDRAATSLADAGLRLGQVGTESHPTASQGHVVWQDPPSGTSVTRGQTVTLVVSSGPQRIPVPDLNGYDAALAEQILAAAGLAVGRTEATQAPAPKDVVINSRPPAGTSLLPGASVTLVVSVGAPTIPVPNLAGLTPLDADSALARVGLRLGTSMRRTMPTAREGTIIDQDPAPGTLSAPGTPINVTLARGGTQ